jgi:hypothetical protein
MTAETILDAQPGRSPGRQMRNYVVPAVHKGNATSRMLGTYHPNFFHCPSETTSTEPSTTLMAVCSSMA